MRYSNVKNWAAYHTNTPPNNFGVESPAGNTGLERLSVRIQELNLTET
jgi:hypothetical protein